MQMTTKAIEDSMIRIYPDSVYRIYELRVHDGWRIYLCKKYRSETRNNEKEPR